MNIYNVIILDESGSMSSIYKETLTSMNEVLSGIRKNQEEFPEQRHYVTIVTFEGNGIDGIKTRRDRVPIGAVEPFTEKDYRPGGCTPLYDAMGYTMSKLESVLLPDDKVIVSVITDGMENSSREYNGKIVKNMVTRLRGKGWAIAYLGANQDSIEVARELDILYACDWLPTSEGVSKVSRSTRHLSKKMAEAAHFGFEWKKMDQNIFDEKDEV